MFETGWRDSPALALHDQVPHDVLIVQVHGGHGGDALADVAELGLEVLQLDAALVPGLVGALSVQTLGNVAENLGENGQYFHIHA